MDRRVLVPLDGSPLAEHVLPYARVLAAGLKAPVHLLACLSQTMNVRGEHGELLRLAQDYLARCAEPFEQAGLRVVTSVAQGEPAAEIAAEADREAGTLLVMSTHGRSGLERAALGSVTDRVLHATASPTLVIRPDGNETPGEPLLRKALVALDESELAEEAIPHAESLAVALGLDLEVVEVLSADTEYYLKAEAFAGAARDLAEDTEGKSRDYLSRVAARLRSAGAAQVETSVLHGPPAASLITAAQSTPGSMVILTTHGRSGVGRWLLGSVTDRVIRHSSRPVLVIRPSAAGKQVLETLA